MDINCSSWGQTALTKACSEGYRDMVKLLLEHGADPNDKSYIGCPALFDVTDPDIIDLLIQYGANPNDTNYFGQTALYSFINQRKYLVLDMKMEEFCVRDPRSIRAIIRAFKNGGALMNMQNDEGDTPLHCLMRNLAQPCRQEYKALLLESSPYVASVLLECGADCTIKNKEGISVARDVQKILDDSSDILRPYEREYFKSQTVRTQDKSKSNNIVTALRNSWV